MPPTRATPPGNGPEQTHVDGVHLQVTRDTDRPSKIACREAVAKRRAQPITCICQDAGEAHAGRDHAIDLSKCDLRLGTCGSIFDRNARTIQPRWITSPTLRKKKTQR